jgi:gluconolactonase
MAVVSHSPRLEALIAPDAALEQLHTGSQFTEGPLWNELDHYLLFSDIPSSVIRRWTRGGGGVYRSDSHMSNGLTYDRDLRLIACEHATSQLTRTEADGTTTVLASHYRGKQLNSPNDVIVARDGTIVFTDPISGRMPFYGIERESELGFFGVYKLPPGGGELELLADDYELPNGLCFSPDESLLYVNDLQRMHIKVYDWREGRAENVRMFFEQANPQGLEGHPDGMKVDERGNVWVTGPGGIWVLSPEGEHLGTIELPERGANLAWGGESRRELFVCATTSLYRIPTLVAGCRLPYMR